VALTGITTKTTNTMAGCKGKILARARWRQRAYFCGKNHKKNTTFAGKTARLLFHFSFSQPQTAATVSLLFFFGPQFAAENENLNF